MSRYLILILSICLTAAWPVDLPSQPPSPTSRIEGGTEPHSQTGSAEKETDDNQRGAHNLPFSVGVLPTTKADEKATEDKTESFKKSLNDWGIPLFTGLSTIIFFAQLVVFGRQARRLKETVDAMRESRRPYILIDCHNCTIGTSPDTASNMPSFDYSITNYGDGPAVVIHYWEGVFAAPSVPPPSILQQVHAELTLKTLAKNGTISRHPVGTPDRFDDRALRAIRLGPTELFFLGQILYEDVFYKRYITQFCFVGNRRGDVHVAGEKKHNYRT